MTATPFDWTRLIAEMTDESLGIPPDVIFQIEENGQLHEVKAHKMILGMVSPTFKTMFYATDVGDKTAKMTKIEKTNVLAVQIVIDAVFNIKSIEASLEGKSVDEVFYVVNLLERYQIAELMEAVKDQLAKFPITDDTVLEVAGKAMKYTTQYEAQAKLLLITCAKFLQPKLEDANSMIRYVADNEDRKEVVATLLARMNDIMPAQEANVTVEPFAWSNPIAEMADENFGIPPDIEENDRVEVKAHKMILGMVSPTFRTMFYATDVGDKTAKAIKILKTTAPAFQIMMDAVYNVKSIEDSLEGKPVHEVFDVMILVDRYQIVELMEATKQLLGNYPITDDTVLDVAEDAKEYTRMFEAEAQQLLVTCAKFLDSKLKDRNAVTRYAAENKDHGAVFAALLALMNDMAPAEKCDNCKKEICQDDEMVKDYEFRVGLVVTNIRASGHWGNDDYGTGRITQVGVYRVTVATVKRGVTQNGVNGQQFGGGLYHKGAPNRLNFLFRCN